MDPFSLQNKLFPTKKRDVSYIASRNCYQEKDFLRDPAPAVLAQPHAATSYTKFHTGFYRRQNPHSHETEAEKKVVIEEIERRRQVALKQRQELLKRETQKSGLLNPITAELAVTGTSAQRTDVFRPHRRQFPLERHGRPNTITPPPILPSNIERPRSSRPWDKDNIRELVFCYDSYRQTPIEQGSASRPSSSSSTSSSRSTALW